MCFPRSTGQNRIDESEFCEATTRACLPMGCSQWATGICHQSAKPSVLAPYLPLQTSCFRRVGKKTSKKHQNKSKHQSQGWCTANHNKPPSLRDIHRQTANMRRLFHWSWDPHMLLMTRAAARPDNNQWQPAQPANICKAANLFGYC